MENRNIIIILLVIIVVLSAAIGATLLKPTAAKEQTKIKITSDNAQYEGGNISIKLTDLKKKPLSQDMVNITITNNEGKVIVDDAVKTNKKGNANLDLDLKKGEYIVNVTYGGNENYTGCNKTQNLTIKEEVKQTQNYDSGAFYSAQAGRVIYTGEIHDAPDGHKWRHLGNNEWIKID